MMITIHLDHELARYAGEVCKMRTDRMLTAELRAINATGAKQLPDLAFGATTVTTQFTCSLDVVVVSGHSPLT